MSDPQRPANGVRFELVLQSLEAGVAHYRGHACLPAVALPIAVRASASEATAELGDPIDAERRAAIEKLAIALVRAATRVELQKGDPIPSKIVRWRPFAG